MTKDTTPILDARQVADLIALDKGKGALLASFVAAFSAGAESRIARLGEHIQSADAAGIADQAHALRGSAGNVGAARLAALLEEIEAAAKRGDLDAARALAARVGAEYALARDALRAACGPES